MKKCLLMLGALMIMSACTAPEAVLSLKMQGSSSRSLTFETCRAVSENEIEFVFSRPVTVKNVSLYQEANFRSSEAPGIAVDSVENGNTVKVTLKENAQPGSVITADLLAEDENKNTINVLTTLRARNNRMPELVINEICTEYSNPRTEFIEFKMMSDGNLGGMRVFIIGNSNAARQTIYEFMPAEVKRDEYIVLHLRTVEEDCKDEYGESLNESGGRNATPQSRDIWIPGNTKLVHKDATIIYILNQEDAVLAAVMISSSADSWWSRDYHAQAATFLYSQGFWLSPEGNAGGPVNAARSSGTSNTRTICRDETKENANTASSWYVTVNSGISAGKPNNTGRYSN